MDATCVHGTIALDLDLLLGEDPFSHITFEEPLSEGALVLDEGGVRRSTRQREGNRRLYPVTESGKGVERRGRKRDRRRRYGRNTREWSVEEDLHLAEQVRLNTSGSGSVLWSRISLPDGRNHEMARHRWARVTSKKVGTKRCSACNQIRLGHSCPFREACSP